MYTMVKLRLNALIGIFLLLADEGHTITCVLFLTFQWRGNFEEVAKGGQNFYTASFLRNYRFGGLWMAAHSLVTLLISGDQP